MKLIFNKQSITEYFLIFLLVSSSGFLFLINNQPYSIVIFIISLYIFVKKKLKFDKIYFILIFSIITLILLQFFKFNFFPTLTLVGILIRITTAYFIVKILKENFLVKYSNIMYYITLSSFYFYIILNIIPESFNFFTQNFSLAAYEHGYQKFKYSIGIYTIYEDVSRNSGPFWEPGAFSGFLVIALLFNIIRLKSFKNKQSIVLLIGLFTTFSSTGYIAFMFLIFINLYIKNINFYLKAIVQWLVLPVFILIFLNTDFLYNKITEQLNFASKVNLNMTTETQRFINILRDIEDFKGHEIIGRGPNNATRFSESKVLVRTNGFTDLLVEYGSIFIILLFYFIFRSFKYITNFYNISNVKILILSLVIVFTLLQSEIYFDFPFFWALLFLNTTYYKYKDNI